MLKIGITLRIVEASNYREIRDALSHDWQIFLNKIDTLPVLIPNNLSNVEEFINSFELDGFILSGGDDIGDNQDRDNTETSIVKYAIKNHLPIFGVCRGMQVLNNYFGGKIETDNQDLHIKQNHSIILQKNSILKFNNNHEIVNSFHKNIITLKSISKDFNPIALADDNTIEGFIHKEFPFIGVMWHPERSQDYFNQQLFEKIFFKLNGKNN